MLTEFTSTECKCKFGVVESKLMIKSCNLSQKQTFSLVNESDKAATNILTNFDSLPSRSSKDGPVMNFELRLAVGNNCFLSGSVLSRKKKLYCESSD